MLAENAEFFETYKLEWTAGLRYSRLERDPAKPDVLGEILK